MPSTVEQELCDLKRSITSVYHRMCDPTPEQEEQDAIYAPDRPASQNDCDRWKAVAELGKIDCAPTPTGSDQFSMVDAMRQYVTGQPSTDASRIDLSPSQLQSKTHCSTVIQEGSRIVGVSLHTGVCESKNNTQYEVFESRMSREPSTQIQFPTSEVHGTAQDACRHECERQDGCLAYRDHGLSQDSARRRCTFMHTDIADGPAASIQKTGADTYFISLYSAVL